MTETESTFGAALTRLWSHAPKPLLDGIIATAPAVFEKYGFTPLVIAHCMAQISHECGAGHELVENLNYSPEGIVRTWPSRFPSLGAALPFAHKPQLLADKVYNGRMGNKIGSDMGWTFRGRGGVNTTGHGAYYALAQKMALDLLNDPDLVNRPDLFLECAVVDFIMCGCVPFAKDDDLRGVTHHLNGGFIGLAEREVWLKRWKSALLPVHGQEALFPPPAPRSAGELRFGDTGSEVSALQDDLRAAGYAFGADDGEFHEATRRAVGGFQLDHGLTSTGVADQPTRDALKRSPGKPIAEARATATVQDLRETGSRTIAGADRISVVGGLLKGFGWTGIGGAVAGESGALDLDTVQAGIDKAHQAAGIVGQLKGVAAWALGAAKPLLIHPATLPIAVALAIGGLILLLEARKIRRARLEDHRSAVNMGR